MTTAMSLATSFGQVLTTWENQVSGVITTRERLQESTIPKSNSPGTEHIAAMWI